MDPVSELTLVGVHGFEVVASLKVEYRDFAIDIASLGVSPSSANMRTASVSWHVPVQAFLDSRGDAEKVPGCGSGVFLPGRFEVLAACCSNFTASSRGARPDFGVAFPVPFGTLRISIQEAASNVAACADMT